MGFYFTPKEISNVARYKGGQTVDNSPLYKYFFSPACAKLVSITPSWVAPNVLTLGGLVCNIASYVLGLYYMPNLGTYTEPPQWVFFMMGLLILIYIFLDNMDGKQAFRTGSSSPMGELLDHGCDSLTIAIYCLGSASAIQGGLWDAVIFVTTGFIAFYLAHWQEYFNHYLDLGYLGPTEAECFVILLYWVTWIMGPAFWVTPVTLFGITLPPNKIILYLALALSAFPPIISFFTGLQLANKNGIKTTTAMSQLIPFTVSYVSYSLMIVFSPELYEAHPHMVLLTANLLFSYLTINCIVQRICSLPYRYFYWPMIPVILAGLNSVSGSFLGHNLIPVYQFFYGMTAFYSLLFLHFSAEVISLFCVQLKIKFLTIPYPNKATKK